MLNFCFEIKIFFRLSHMFFDNLLDFGNKVKNNFRFNCVFIILNCKCMV